MRWLAASLLLLACTPPVPAHNAGSADGPREATQHPPIRGGTLLVTRDGRTAVVSDDERDTLWIVDIDDILQLRGRVDLERGDQPWRLAEDERGRVHASLHGGGALATIDVESRTLLARRPVCAAPAGVTWDPDEDRTLVVCRGGEVVSVTDERVQKLARLEPDLRDVWVSTGAIGISRFRSAQVLSMDDSTRLVAPTAQIPVRSGSTYSASYAATVAWRTVPEPDGGAWMLHQRQRETEFVSSRAFLYYGATNGEIIKPSVTYIGPDGVGTGVTIEGEGVLPVDIAPSPDGSLLALAFAAQGGVQIMASPHVTRRLGADVISSPYERAVAVAWSGRRVIGHLMDPPRLAMIDADTGRMISLVPLGDTIAEPPGRELFHRATSTRTTCASCHPEAGDDGFVWHFRLDLVRRTPSLTGGVLSTAPYHWDGEHRDFRSLLDAVFTTRMGGGETSDYEVESLGAWLDAQPAESFERWDEASIARGQRLFESARTECATCHSGPRLTDNESYDVGTGGSLQTPSLLGLRARAPYLHDGRAPTLRARLTTHHTHGHGRLDGLSERELDDLHAYLSNL